MECPRCNKTVNKLTIPLEGKLGCVECNGTPKINFICDLGTSVDTYIRKDGTTGKITKGKEWEMSHRRISPDGKEVYNNVTKRDTQY